ncbi:hypothetical protein UFOVP49_11 [uncultured Caudovirales phage]|uniref:Baseplate wedge subunit n=1 Tax=uncultured Caudovirales phage TaxID=2100421 RepID=A0A6J5KP88_9CAUD|nr:hypothetical protein UFOVP49_11 [uncultured Caudovirales phage]
MAILENKISSLIDDQIPEFIKEDHPNFVAFIKAYYEWMENSQEGAVLYETKKLLDYRDVDKTSEEFLKYFKKQLLPNFPEEILSDKAKLIKNIRSFYQKKGSPESLNFLFRALYGQDIDILYPKENILKASDGKWRIPRAFKLTVSNTPVGFDLNSLKGRRITGVTSQASCTVEGAYKALDSGTNQEVFEIYVSDVNRLFTNGETVEASYIDENGVKVVVFSERVIGSLSNIKIDPKNRGLNYKVGDPVVFEDGLSTIDPQILKAIAIVSNVTSGQVQSLSLVNGGYGYSLYPNTTVLISNTSDDLTGTGAEARVTSVDIARSELLDVNSDAIETNKDLLISGTYNFPGNPGSDKNTPMSTAFSYSLMTVYPIKSVIVTNKGQNYTSVPDMIVQSHFSTDYSGDPSNTNWQARKQFILDLGIIAHVDVVHGGINYSNTTDSLYIDGNGYSAEFDFITDINGTITSVIVANGGEGYLSTGMSISTVNGSNAELRAYRYGEGAEADITVDKIGSILNFKLLSRGSGYVKKPKVSLKIKDIIVSQVLDTGCDFVYQGTDQNTASFSANVDSFFKIATDNVARVYNNTGIIDDNLVLKFTLNGANTFTASFSNNNVTTYGNGLAKANAEFLNGLIEYDGFFLNTDGFLSADKKLQDSVKYHNFSYVVIAEKALNEYRQTLLDIAHPAGTKLIGYNQLLNRVGSEVEFRSNVYITSNSALGSISADPFDANANSKISGFGTEFNVSTNVNDMIVLNYVTQPAITITNRGYGYRVNSNSIVALSNFGSIAYIADLDNANVVSMNVNIDAIYYNKDLPLNSVSYLFPNSPSASLSTTLGSAFKYENISVAPIGHMRIDDPGIGSSRPRVSMYSYYSTDLSGYTFAKPDPTDSVWIAYRQELVGLGRIAHVDVLDGGTGYDAANDSVYIDSTNGYGASFTITVANGVIQAVDVTSGGEGYIDVTMRANTSTGSNAEFRVYRYGEGAAAEVSPIGSRKQTKLIIGKTSNTSINVESNTRFIGDGRLNFQSNSNVATISGNVSQLAIIQDDIIRYNVESVTMNAIVTYIFGNTITLNTVSTSTNTNIVYEVYPYFDNVNYRIISTI